MARRLAGEMDRQDQRVGVGMFVHEFHARRARHFRVVAEDGAELRLAYLNRVMHQIAAEHRVIAARFQVQADMARRMTGRWLEPKTTVDLMVARDQIDLTGLDHRQHTVGE